VAAWGGGEGERREGRNNGEWGDVGVESGFYSDFRAWARESEIVNAIFFSPRGVFFLIY
jgi:hypothetical protein